MSISVRVSISEAAQGYGKLMALVSSVGRLHVLMPWPRVRTDCLFCVCRSFGRNLGNWEFWGSQLLVSPFTPFTLWWVILRTKETLVKLSLSSSEQPCL